MIWFPKFWASQSIRFKPVGTGLHYYKNCQTRDKRAVWDLKSHHPKFQKDSIMGSPKISGSKIGTLRSENWIFSFETELHQKWLLQWISTPIRPSLNIILTENWVTCPNMGSYFAFFHSIIRIPKLTENYQTFLNNINLSWCLVDQAVKHMLCINVITRLPWWNRDLKFGQLFITEIGL